MLIFLHQKYEIELRNLFRIFEKNRNRKRSNWRRRKMPQHGWIKLHWYLAWWNFFQQRGNRRATRDHQYFCGSLSAVDERQRGNAPRHYYRAAPRARRAHHYFCEALSSVRRRPPHPSSEGQRGNRGWEEMSWAISNRRDDPWILWTATFPGASIREMSESCVRHLI